MDLSSAEPGDQIRISYNGKSNLFEVVIVEGREIIVSSLANPDQQTGLFKTSQGWKVIGGETTPYELTLIKVGEVEPISLPPPKSVPTSLPAPQPVTTTLPTRSLSPKSSESRSSGPKSPQSRTIQSKTAQPKTIQPKTTQPKSPPRYTEDRAAELCSRLILNPKLEVPEEEFNQLVTFAGNNGFGQLGADVASKRRVCEGILQKVVQAQNPDLNVSRINVQNLARQYQSSAAQMIERRAREEEEAKIRAEEMAKTQEQQRRQNQLRKMIQARIDAITDKVNFLRRSAIVRARCLREGHFRKPFSEYQVIVHPELQGRRVFLPQEDWNNFFADVDVPGIVPQGLPQPQAPQVNLLENPLIQEALFDLIGPEALEMDLNNQAIIDMIGLETVQVLAPEVLGQLGQLEQQGPPPAAQSYLKFDIAEPIYATVSGPHGEENNILFVSEMLNEELKRINNPRITRLINCWLHPIGLLNIELLRFPELEQSTSSEELLKNLLIDRIAEYGLLIAGDILTVEADDIQYRYLVKKITNVDNQEVYAAGIPQITQDIRVQVDIQSKEDAIKMIESRFDGYIDPNYI